MQPNLNAACSSVNKLFIASGGNYVNNPFMSDILSRVEQLLTEKGWNWARFARELETTDQRVYNWKKRGVPKSEADRIAAVLGCSTDWLLTGHGPKDAGVFDLMYRTVAAKHRRPWHEHLTDRELHDRVEAMEQAKEDAIQHELDKQRGAYENAGERDAEHQWSMTHNPAPEPESNELEFFGHMDAWDSNTPLDEDEVELPLLREVELAAGGGATQVIENHGAKLRFAKSTLRRAGVPAESAACAFVRGNSMEPVMPDGTCVGVNTADKAIKDGEIYAIDHDGMLRVKYLHRRPGGGIKIVSQNSSEHATEEYSADQVSENNIRVIGRVFWWSVLR